MVLESEPEDPHMHDPTTEWPSQTITKVLFFISLIETRGDGKINEAEKEETL